MKARDVCSVFLVLAIWAAGITSYAQSIGSRKVSCAFQSTRLDEVIRRLSQEAGVSFIYSSTKTNLSKVVTLSVENQSLEETLNQIGAQLDVEFKMQGHYVLIKQQAAEVKSFRRNVAGRVPVSSVNQQVSRSQPGYLVANQSESRRLAIPSFTERELPAFDVLLTQSEVSTVPLPQSRGISARRPNQAGWFISAGTVLNDYSSGFELQAGIRSAYVVFVPTWTSNLLYHQGIGLGTSIPILRDLVIAPIYVLGKSQDLLAAGWNEGRDAVGSTKKEKVIHHQLKLMVQYAVAPSVIVKLGPTINQSTTTVDFYKVTSTVIERRAVLRPSISGLGEVPPTAGLVTVDRITTTRSSKVGESVDRKSWLGWEASVAVKINFLKGK